MDKVTDHHNAVAGRIVSEIVKGTIEAGGDMTSALVLLESITVGVLTAAVNGGEESLYLALMQVRILNRMGPIRDAISRRQSVRTARLNEEGKA